MAEPERVGLFDGEVSPGTRSYQGVYVDETGDLVLEAQDVGKASAEFWGRLGLRVLGTCARG